jgi:hypothetical protein
MMIMVEMNATMVAENSVAVVAAVAFVDYHY